VDIRWNGAPPFGIPRGGGRQAARIAPLAVTIASMRCALSITLAALVSLVMSNAFAVDVLVEVRSSSSGYCFLPDLSPCPSSCSCTVFWNGTAESHLLTGPCTVCDTTFSRPSELSISFSHVGPSLLASHGECTCTSVMEGVWWSIQFSEPVYAQLIGYVQFNGMDWGLTREPRTSFQSSNASPWATSSWTETFRFTHCRPDFDANGEIDGADLAILLSHWGQSVFSLRVDLDDSGVVDGGDIGALLLQWGHCAP